MAFATFNPALKSARVTLSGGNLTAVVDASGNWASVGANFSHGIGKWYSEFTVNVAGSGVFVGVAPAAHDPTTTALNPNEFFCGAMANHGWGYLNGDGQIYTNAVGSAYGATYIGGAVISVLYDADAGTLTFWKNGTSQGTAVTGITGSITFYIALNTSAQITANFGASAFAHTPPAGYVGVDDSADSTPHGNAAPSMLALTADGERQAAGVLALQAFTANGGFLPYGTASLGTMQAIGAGGIKGGAVTLQPLTAAATGISATAGVAVMEAPTAGGTGSVAGLITGDGTIPADILVASGITGAAYSAALNIPALTLSAGFEATADLDVSTLFLDAEAVQGNISEAEVILPVPVLQGVSLAGSAINGNLLGRAPKLQGVMVSETLGLLIETMRPMYLTATALNGDAGEMDAMIPTLTFAGIGFGPYIGTADLSFPTSLFLEATGLSTFAANFRTWVLNVRKKGLTEYTNFSFNSYAEYRDMVLATGDAGMMKLTTADLDLAAQIDATVRTGAESFGTSYNKRVPRIYAGYAAKGDLHFSTYTSQDGKRTYLLPWNNITGVQQRRVPVGRGPKSPYWQFEVSNVEGSDFLLEHLQVYPEKTTRRVV